jgi:hypothetical protein
MINRFLINRKVIFIIDHKPEDPDERSRIEKAGYKVTLDGRVSGRDKK